LTVLVAVAGAAYAEPPSDADIDRLFEVSGTRKMVEDMLPQLERMQEQAINRDAAGKNLTPEQEHQIRAVQNASRRILQRSLSWEEMRPAYLEIYKNTFSKEDILAITEFYASPAGQRLLEKTPLLMRNVVQVMGAKMQPLMDELEAELGQTVQTSPDTGKRK
jgi:hypothetical protein